MSTARYVQWSLVPEEGRFHGGRRYLAFTEQFLDMVDVLVTVLGLPFIYVGWVFIRTPQRGFRIHNWPFGPSQGKGLTEAGKTPYRLRGAFIMALGLSIVLIGLVG